MTAKRRALPGAEVVQLFDRGTIVLGPVVVDDGIIVGDRDSNVVKLDRARPGVSRWSVPGRSFWPRHAVGQVVVGTCRTGLRAYRVSDGESLWEKPGETDFCVRGDRVIVRTGTGVEVRDPISGSAVARPPLAGPIEALQGNWCERFFVQLPPGPSTERTERWRVACVDLDLGRVLWDRVFHDPYPPPLHLSSPGSWAIACCTARTVLVRHGGWTLLALDVDSGEIRWIAARESLLYALPTVQNRLFVPQMQGVSIVDVGTGSVLASSFPNELHAASRPTPAVVYQSRLVVPHESGHIAVYDTADGRPVHVRSTGYRLWRGVEVDGRLVVSTGDGAILVFDESIWGLD